LRAKGEPADLGEVTAELRRRDGIDAARAAAPMRPADDAQILDTTALDADAAFTRALQLLAGRV
jgi:cytidylate kinase